MKVHDEIEALADVYAAGGLEGAEREDVERHVAGCERCAAILREARHFREWISSTIAPDAPSADLEDRIIENLWKSSASKARRWRRRPARRSVRIVGAVAAAGLLIVIGNLFSQSQVPSPEAEEALAVMPAQKTTSAFESRKNKDGQGPLSRTAWGENATRASSGKVFMPGSADVPMPAASPPVPESKPSSLSEPRSAERAEQNRPSREPGNLDKVVEAEKALGQGIELSFKSEPRASFQDNRKIIRNADIQLEVESYDATYTKVAEIVQAEKGFIAGADTQRLANGKMRATVTVRVPPERFEAAIAKVRELGTVRHQNITSQDVTKAYMDLEARLGSKQALVERLKKVLAEAKGNVKELMEVEVQMGKTIEEIEAIKGELKYYDNLVGLSTIILQIAEKDLGLPFEYVQTLQSNIGLTVRDPDDAYAKAQKVITDAGGQVVDSKMTRQNDGSAHATLRGRVDAEKFPPVREALKALGHVDTDTVNQQKTARGGREGVPKPDAPLRREQAMIDLAIATPQIFVTRRAQVTIETGGVEAAYQAARKAVESASGRITDGSLTGQTDRMNAVVRAQVDAEKFTGLVEALKALGTVKNAAVNVALPANATGGTPRPITELAEIEFVVYSPPQLIAEEHGLSRVIRDTFSGSVAGLMWSIEKLFVGLSLAGPWLALALVGWLVWRRARRKAKAAQPAPPAA